MSSQTDREQRFRAAYAAGYQPVRAFVQRRAAPGEVDDIVAEAMLIAWRRAGDLPDGDGAARAWLFGITRNVLLNHARSLRRRDALAVRVAAQGTGGVGSGEADAAISRIDLAAAWARLRPAEQEVIALRVYDGLDSAQAGQVLGITSAAYRLRLSRARSALRRHLEGAGSRPAPVLAPPTRS